ncbi:MULTISPECIES: sigma-54-dependent Fis family transcriptional regulator [unclassified Bacillus (in: firmicutes)]|uniref:sigma-54 interaction domain-containing protein n=1 Tax=unclassified Bacillus (in: firmicutes) TaxID=185979 RepID=UPI0008E5FE5C|nr:MULTISPECIES: sigma 54-interacting transcriptional regulator [unclassified Bacillus (in: firmicutes)]SFA92117.1 arginine utilization regulatory protein [Bacillus sp. UNCCL13]SFQ85801.1 arginine utilization regulatory protein [Bacillus sp. cl95]
MVNYQEMTMTSEILGAILKSIDEGIHVVNNDGVTIYYNEVAAKHDGMLVDEVLGKKLLDVFPSLTDKTSTLLKVIKTEKPIYNQPQLYKNIHGRDIETINTTIPILVDNKVIGAAEIAKDYTRMKVLSERLLELQSGIHNKHSINTENTKHTKFTLNDLKTVNPEFKSIKDKANLFAKSDSPILVYGESGTGKELFIQGIHQNSLRASGPFIAQNCAAIPETLLESILFGTAKGSYTGAVERKGLFELADGGTLFLDELHAMPIELQAKLLRVLEDGEIRKIGSSKSISVNVRVIAAMNEHPRKAMEGNRLKADLFYRLNVFTFSLIPLRERKEDILYLTHFFIQKFNKQLGKEIEGIDEELELAFVRHQWPGNVRELKHTIEYMVNISSEKILTSNDLPIMFKQMMEGNRETANKNSLSLNDHLRELEMNLINKAIAHSGGNIKKAAELLDIPRQTLQYKLQKYSK